MQWVKIFSGESEAKQVLKNDKPQLLIVHGKRICLVMHEESYYAVQDRCTHSGESLSGGTVNYLCEVVCPLHNYRFDLQTGRECGSKSDDLITYPVKMDEDGFFIGIW